MWIPCFPVLICLLRRLLIPSGLTLWFVLQIFIVFTGENPLQPTANVPTVNFYIVTAGFFFQAGMFKNSNKCPYLIMDFPIVFFQASMYILPRKNENPYEKRITEMIAFITRYPNDSAAVCSIVQKLIEQRIVFTGFLEQELPKAIPEDFENYPAMIVDAQLLKEADSQLRCRLEKYASEHYLFPIPPAEKIPPEDFDFCLHFYETEIGMFISAAGLEPETLPHQTDEGILKKFIPQVREYFARIPGMSHFNEYHLHCLLGALALENTPYAPDGWTTELNNIMKVMFEHRDIHGDHDQLGAWILASFYAERTGDQGPADWMLGYFDEILKRRPRTSEGLLSPGGFRDDPLFYFGEDRDEFGSVSYTVARRDLVLNEQLHFLAGAFAAASRYSGNPKYLREAEMLLDHIEKYHRDPADSLLRHASRCGKAIGEKWGRGNCHALLGALYMLLAYPEMPQQIRNKVVMFLDKTGEGLMKVQAASGLWHNLLDNPASAEETSCTVIFCYIYSWLTNRGEVPPEKYRNMIVRARDVLKTQFWRGKGAGNCTGTWVAFNDPSYYLRRPHHMWIMPLIAPALLESHKIVSKQLEMNLKKGDLT